MISLFTGVFVDLVVVDLKLPNFEIAARHSAWRVCIKLPRIKLVRTVWMFGGKIENLLSDVCILQKTSNRVISRRHQNESGKETCQIVKRTCGASRTSVFVNEACCFMAFSYSRLRLPCLSFLLLNGRTTRWNTLVSFSYRLRAEENSSNSQWLQRALPRCQFYLVEEQEIVYKLASNTISTSLTFERLKHLENESKSQTQFCQADSYCNSATWK